ncbi:MAG: cupredoxin domain-containing protein [Chloroflexi bacterium]|nr:cupredoxin domain-containing protein [Chloroflexota bacterium]
MKFRSIALTAVAIVVFAACGGSAATKAPASAATSAPASTTPSVTPSTAPSDGMSMAPSVGHSMAPTPSDTGAPTAGTPVTVKDFSLDPKDVTIQGAGALAVTNAGPTVHNIAIRDGAGKVVATTKELKTGEAESLTVDLPAGAYTLFCSLPGHESLGIKGTLTVTR